MRRLVFVLPLLACSNAEAPTPRLEAPPVGAGFQVGFEVMAPPATEIWKCRISKLRAPEGFNAVGRAESKQTRGMHHMNVLALTLTGVDLPPGIYDCADLYRDHPALMENGTYIYASQDAEQEIDLPDGVVAHVPGGIDVMHEIHFVNTTEAEIEVFSYVNGYIIEDDGNSQSIWGGVLRDEQIQIPPNSTHNEWTRCVLDEDIDVLFLASHTHRRGKKVTIHRFDGTDRGELLYENDDWHTPKLQDYADELLHIPAGTGFEMNCEFENRDDHQVVYGFDAEDEMCQIAFVYTPGDSSIACNVTATSN